MSTQELQARANALPRTQRHVMWLFMEGGKYSVADISSRLHLSDPRSHIRCLRKKGFAILDEWKETEFGNRYKVYYHKAPSE